MYTVPEIAVKPDHTFSIEAKTETFVGLIQGKFDDSTTVSGVQGIAMCGSVAGIDMNVPAWRGQWVSPELASGGNEAVEPASTPVPILPANTPAPTILAPLPMPTPIVYVVQASDTLFGIAAKFQVDMATLMKLNNLTGGDLTVGQTLIISPSSAVEP